MYVLSTVVPEGALGSVLGTLTVCGPGVIPHDEAENQIPVLVTLVSKVFAPQKRVAGTCCTGFCCPYQALS